MQFRKKVVLSEYALRSRSYAGDYITVAIKKYSVMKQIRMKPTSQQHSELLNVFERFRNHS